MKIFQFQKERSLDNIVEASFALLRKHFVPFAKILWKYNAVFIVMFVAVTYLLNYYLMSSFINNPNRMLVKDYSYFFQNKQILIYIFVYMLISFVFYNRFYATLMGYIRVYKENNGIVSAEEVNKYIKKKFSKLIGLSIIITAFFFVSSFLFFFLMTLTASISSNLIIIIFVLFLMLFIYLLVPITFSYPVLFYDDKSIAQSLSLGFKYVKHRWWYSFFTLLVMIVILWLLGYVVQLPIYFYENFKDISALSKTTLKGIEGSSDVLYSVISTLTLIVNYILKIAFLFAISLLFFSLKEYHTQEGILERIEQIGNNE